MKITWTNVVLALASIFIGILVTALLIGVGTVEYRNTPPPVQVMSKLGDTETTIAEADSIYISQRNGRSYLMYFSFSPTGQLFLRAEDLSDTTIDTSASSDSSPFDSLSDSAKQ